MKNTSLLECCQLLKEMVLWGYVFKKFLFKGSLYTHLGDTYFWWLGSYNFLIKFEFYNIIIYVFLKMWWDHRLLENLIVINGIAFVVVLNSLWFCKNCLFMHEGMLLIILFHLRQTKFQCWMRRLSISRCFNYNFRYRDSIIHYTNELMLFLLERLLI
jgi:hypothetical protein